MGWTMKHMHGSSKWEKSYNSVMVKNKLALSSVLDRRSSVDIEWQLVFCNRYLVFGFWINIKKWIGFPFWSETKNKTQNNNQFSFLFLKWKNKWFFDFSFPT